jgi:hypothetical protein
LIEAEKITSSRLRQQVREQQQVLRQVREQQVQAQQQELQQQVQEEFLFYRKRPKQQPTKLPRGVIFSWGFLKEWFEKFRGMPHASVNNLYMQPSRWTQAPSTQPLIIGEFPNGLSVSFLSLFNRLEGAAIPIAPTPPKLPAGFH